MNSLMLVWETTDSCRNWEVIAECSGHLRSVWTLCYVRDSARLASGSADHTIKIWNPKGWACEHTLKDHSGWVVGLSCAPGLLLSCSIDQGIRAWSAKTWQCERNFLDQDYEVYCVCSFAGGRFATAGAEMAILVYGGPEHDKPEVGHGGTAFPGLGQRGALLDNGSLIPSSVADPPRTTSPGQGPTSKARTPST